MANEEKDHDMYYVISYPTNEYFSFRIYWDYCLQMYCPLITDSNRILPLSRRRDFQFCKMSMHKVATNSNIFFKWLNVASSPKEGYVNIDGTEPIDKTIIPFIRYTVFVNNMVGWEYRDLYRTINLEKVLELVRKEGIVVVYDHFDDKLFICKIFSSKSR